MSPTGRTPCAVPAPVLALALALGACGSPPPPPIVDVTYLASYRPTEVRTWAMDLADCEVDDDPRIDDALLRPWIVDAVRDVLTARGLEEVPLDAADLALSYHLNLGTDVQLGTEVLRAWLYVRDVESDRYVWLAERRTGPAHHDPDETPEDRRERVRAVVAELLGHLDVLRLPPPDPAD